MNTVLSTDRCALIEGDCVEVLRGFPDASLDSIVTDPPYDLTSGSPYGRSRIGTGGGGFMGAHWDATGIAFDPVTWCECLRVLKPGGHLLAFGGARTYHRMMCAIEDAGFETRDCFSWHYGSGFPKSANVSKLIDKAAGAKRKVVGVSTTVNQKSKPSATAMGERKLHAEFGDRVAVTAAATDAAKQWEGWGSALKPSWEPIVVARKPLIGTVAANVLEHGTGALNIDASRVQSGPSSSVERRQAAAPGELVGGTGWVTPARPESYNDARVGEALGRWPSNTLFSHSALCVEVGTREVVSHNPDNKTLVGDATTVSAYGEFEARSSVGHAQDGKETVALMACVPGCPVRELDNQSGKLKSGRMAKGTIRAYREAPSGAFGAAAATDKEITGDEGAASRFFNTFPGADPLKGEVPFKYQAKAPASERWGLRVCACGVEAGPAKEGRESRGEKCAACGDEIGTIEHPTVKPIELMLWLVRLVTPPGGTVLDCFAGSGTTGIAALRAGFAFVGIERDPAHCLIAAARLRSADT